MVVAPYLGGGGEVGDANAASVDAASAAAEGAGELSRGLRHRSRTTSTRRHQDGYSYNYYEAYYDDDDRFYYDAAASPAKRNLTQNSGSHHRVANYSITTSVTIRVTPHDDL